MSTQMQSSQFPILTSAHLSQVDTCQRASTDDLDVLACISTSSAPISPKGRAAHTFLMRAFTQFELSRSIPLDIPAQVQDLLESGSLLSRQQVEASVAEVEAWVKWAISQVAGTFEVISVGQAYERQATAMDGKTEFILRSRPDLILQYADGSVEIVTFRTEETVESSLIQLVAVYATLPSRLRHHCPTFVELDVRTQEVRARRFDLTQAQAEWSRILATAPWILSSTAGIDSVGTVRSSTCDGLP